MLLIFIALGCSSSRQESLTTPTSTQTDGPGRTVANMDVKDPKGRFLGEVVAYLVNLSDADLKMAQSFTSGDAQAIKNGIINAEQVEKNDFATIEVPQIAYKRMAPLLLKIHHDHQRTYLAYIQTFLKGNAQAKTAQVDKGNAILTQSYADMEKLKDMVTKEMKKYE